MADNRILQTILDTVLAVRSEVAEVKENVKDNGDKLTRLSESLRYLENDTPTIKEFNRLERRVSKLEKQTISP